MWFIGDLVFWQTFRISLLSLFAIFQTDQTFCSKMFVNSWFNYLYVSDNGQVKSLQAELAAEEMTKGGGGERGTVHN